MIFVHYDTDNDWLILSNDLDKTLYKPYKNKIKLTNQFIRNYNIATLAFRILKINHV